MIVFSIQILNFEKKVVDKLLSLYVILFNLTIKNNENYGFVMVVRRKAAAKRKTGGKRRKSGGKKKGGAKRKRRR